MRPPKFLVIAVSLLCIPLYYPLLVADAFVTERALLLSRPNFAGDLNEADYLRNRKSIRWHLKFAPQTYYADHSSSTWCNTRKFFASAHVKSTPEVDQCEITKRQGGSTLDPWLQRVVELHEYQQRWGNCLVPKRYEENPQLANWCSKQRQQYKKYVASDSQSSLTPDRVETLNRLGFVWNATGLASNCTPKRPRPRKRLGMSEADWWNEFSKLESIIQEETEQMKNASDEYIDLESQLLITKNVAVMTVLSQIPAKSATGRWLADQRKEYRLWTSGDDEHFCEFNVEKSDALLSLDESWWMSFRDRAWHIRYYTLISYKERYGDTLCKINFRSKRLANWCSNQRKLYNLKTAGRRTTLSDDRQAKLEDIAFVWDRWEYEFEQKCVH